MFIFDHARRQEMKERRLLFLNQPEGGRDAKAETSERAPRPNEERDRDDVDRAAARRTDEASTLTDEETERLKRFNGRLSPDDEKRMEPYTEELNTLKTRVNRSSTPQGNAERLRPLTLEEVRAAALGNPETVNAATELLKKFKNFRNAADAINSNLGETMQLDRAIRSDAKSTYGNRATDNRLNALAPRTPQGTYNFVASLASNVETSFVRGQPERQPTRAPDDGLPTGSEEKTTPSNSRSVTGERQRTDSYTADKTKKPADGEESIWEEYHVAIQKVNDTFGLTLIFEESGNLSFDESSDVQLIKALGAIAKDPKISAPNAKRPIAKALEGIMSQNSDRGRNMLEYCLTNLRAVVQEVSNGDIPKFPSEIARQLIELTMQGYIRPVFWNYPNSTTLQFELKKSKKITESPLYQSGKMDPLLIDQFGLEPHGEKKEDTQA